MKGVYGLMAVSTVVLLGAIQISVVDAISEQKKVLERIEIQDPTKLPIERLNNKKELIKGEVYLKVNQDSIVIRNSRKGEVKIGIPKIEGKVQEIEGQSIISTESVDIIIQAIDGGVRQVINLKDSNAPKKYEFSIEVPKGYKLKINNSGGIDIINRENQGESGILPPWARDAEGKEVKTWYSLQGKTLVQHIDTTNVTYPILADPTYCSQYTSSVWNEWRGGWDTIRVIPTGCGRYFAWLDMTGSFNEMHRKSGRNLTGDRYWSVWWQWDCHADYATFESTWDLEVARPNVGYWPTVTAGCNPK